MKLVGDVADELHRECYVVGGYVRDIFLERPSNDMDFVTLGSGIEVAKAVARRIGKRAHLAVFRTYGTAQVKTRQWELEFVGARRESYHRESRNPIVEDGTLDDDQKRRDFTINAMAICLNKERYGELIDPFDGIGDLERRIIRTPLDPDITFSDDPLRMMRAVRFATQLGFDIYPETFSAIRRNAKDENHGKQPALTRLDAAGPVRAAAAHLPRVGSPQGRGNRQRPRPQGQLHAHVAGARQCRRRQP